MNRLAGAATAAALLAFGTSPLETAAAATPRATAAAAAARSATPAAPPSPRARAAATRGAPAAGAARRPPAVRAPAAEPGRGPPLSPARALPGDVARLAPPVPWAGARPPPAAAAPVPPWAGAPPGRDRGPPRAGARPWPPWTAPPPPWAMAPWPGWYPNPPPMAAPRGLAVKRPPPPPAPGVRGKAVAALPTPPPAPSPRPAAVARPPAGGAQPGPRLAARPPPPLPPPAVAAAAAAAAPRADAAPAPGSAGAGAPAPDAPAPAGRAEGADAPRPEPAPARPAATAATAPPPGPSALAAALPPLAVPDDPRRARVAAAVRAAAEATGFDPDTLLAIAMAESALRPDARNPRSTAAGPLQFTAGTWMAAVFAFPDRVPALAPHRARIQALAARDAALGRAAGLKPKQRRALLRDLLREQAAARDAALALRFDPATAARVAATLALDDAERFRALTGSPPAGPGEVYAVHLLGVGAAAELARAGRDRPGASVAALLPPGVVAANPEIFRGPGGGALPVEAARLRIAGRLGIAPPAAAAAKPEPATIVELAEAP